MTERVQVTTDGHVAIVTLNRPDKRNAVDAAMTAALVAAFDRIEQDDTLRVTVLTGAGPVFCAGMDLAAFQAGEGDAVLFGAYGFAGFVRRPRRKPVIAAVEGGALAGGFEVMLACDLAIGAKSARFGVPEVKLGLVAGGGGAIRLGRRLPVALANEMLLTGRSYDAARMQDWGLLNDVVDDGDARAAALALAHDIAANALIAVQTSLALSGQATAEAAGLWDHNDQALKTLSKSADLTEGVAAFMEKRPPVWTGR